MALNASGHNTAWDDIEVGLLVGSEISEDAKNLLGTHDVKADVLGWNLQGGRAREPPRVRARYA